MSVLLDMMTDTAWVPFWTAIVAAAGILQALFLIVNAILVWRYLGETKELRKATQKQVDKSQSLVETAQNQLILGREELVAIRAQVAASQAQAQTAQDGIEGQIRPALITNYTDTFQLSNIGSGPALHIRFSKVDRGSGVMWDADPFPMQILSIYAKGQAGTNIRLRTSPHAPGASVLDGMSLQCTYRSLSGHTHATVVDLDERGNAEDTRFYVRPR
jgi:hypothetical protein